MVTTVTPATTATTMTTATTVTIATTVTPATTATTATTLTTAKMPVRNLQRCTTPQNGFKIAVQLNYSCLAAF